ncbi:MAG: hypothetical protein MI923_11510 [Phycisphaerales bacterium]|nr:hypothetical protein [Phycisphaerales bacterium]
MSRSITLIELLFTIVALLFGIAGATLFANRFDGNWARPLGCFSGCFVFVLLVFLLSFLKTRLVDGIPYIPICRNGQCHRDDYRIDTKEDRACWTCKCGDSYERVGRRFVLLEEKNERHYLIWHPMKGWIADEKHNEA